MLAVPSGTAPHRAGRLAVLLPLTAFTALWAAPATAQLQVVRVPVSGTVEMGLAPFIERVLEEAADEGADAVVLDIETQGGRVDAALRITSAVSRSAVPVYSFVNMYACSAGAMIALSAERVVMTTRSATMKTE